ncbi:DUF4231 domain-containing protein [Pelagicoccus sp. SDUM812003]|uniref:DUF4231 domain-containing protein n=1 Tax=Pelagicoccus sp. SDUM812003 TaxID=3041267 RepID=UPI00280E50BE|nr:DUF4231 domain-containing protein [Pelagicoccus sp. SDUM812003]MDQ8204286.1 DUF4231 domain-containing protein [Pelagicoccus sp. SDUM812003]
MTSDEYVKERLDGQIRWYSSKSQAAQKSYRLIRRTEIVVAAMIPFLAAFTDMGRIVPVAIGVLGAAIVVLASLQNLGNYNEKWVEYRSTCEALKQEKYRFLTNSKPYDQDDSLPELVERVERLVASENTHWTQWAKASKPVDESAED